MTAQNQPASAISSIWIFPEHPAAEFAQIGFVGWFLFFFFLVSRADDGYFCTTNGWYLHLPDIPIPEQPCVPGTLSKTIPCLMYLWQSLVSLPLNEIWWVSGRGKHRYMCIILYSAIKHSLINSVVWGFHFSQREGSCWHKVKSLSSQQKNAEGQVQFC